MNIRQLVVLATLGASFGAQAYSVKIFNLLAPGYFESNQQAPPEPAQYDVLVWTVASNGQPDIMAIAPSGVQVQLDYSAKPASLNMLTVPKDPNFKSTDGFSYQDLFAVVGNAQPRPDLKMTAGDYKTQAIKKLGEIIKGNRSIANQYFKIDASELPADNGTLYLLPKAPELSLNAPGVTGANPWVKDVKVAQYWSGVESGAKRSLPTDAGTVSNAMVRVGYLNWLIAILKMFQGDTTKAITSRNAFRTYLQGILNASEAKSGAVPKAGQKLSPGAINFFGTYVPNLYNSQKARSGDQSDMVYWYNTIKSTN